MTVGVRERAAGHWRAALWCGAGFLGMVLLVGLGWARAFDEGLSTAAKAGTPCWVRNTSEAVSVLVAGEVSLVYVLAFGAFCAWRGKLAAGGAVVALLLGTVGVEFFLKSVLYQPSPGLVLADVEAPRCWSVGYPLTSVGSTIVANTLPSGYVTRTAYFGVLIAWIAAIRWPWLATRVWLAVGAVVLVLAASRVFIVWHWTTDVLAGILLGATAACVALAIADGFRWLGTGRRKLVDR